jgi:ubiquinone/menaquinone biosynthesis C-methylase UbiE
MEKINLLNHISEIYKNGENITSHLKNLSNSERNNTEDILISYDFQAGSYIRYVKENKEYIDKYSQAIVNSIDKLWSYESILEIGVGESTTLANVLLKISQKKEVYGFDLSRSRVKYGETYIKELWLEKQHNINLFTWDLFNIPLQDNSIDIIYTSHSIEPNGGKEKEALEELYRITGKYLILLEPSYPFASEEGKERMKKHGYITKLHDTAKELGYEIIEYRLFDLYANPLNPTELIVIKKGSTGEKNTTPFICPNTKTALYKKADCYFSPEWLIAYPILGWIPCLLKENGIVATKYSELSSE